MFGRGRAGVEHCQGGLEVRKVEGREQDHWEIQIDSRYRLR